MCVMDGRWQVHGRLRRCEDGVDGREVVRWQGREEEGRRRVERRGEEPWRTRFSAVVAGGRDPGSTMDLVG